MLSKFMEILAVHGTAVVRWVGWNVSLAVIPVLFGYALLGVVKSSRTRPSLWKSIGAALLLGLWLAFVPNTCYLLTEWRHFLVNVANPDLLREAGTHPKIILSAEAFFFFVYSGIGTLCFVLAIRPIEATLRIWKKPFWSVAFALFFLISLGVYLGLILRLNSWDLVSDPDSVFLPISKIPGNHLLLVVLVVFALFPGRPNASAMICNITGNRERSGTEPLL